MSSGGLNEVSIAEYCSQYGVWAAEFKFARAEKVTEDWSIELAFAGAWRGAEGAVTRPLLPAKLSANAQ